MKTYKYPLGKQSNTIRIGNLLDDMWQVHDYFHRWQDQRYKDGLPYADWYAICLILDSEFQGIARWWSENKTFNLLEKRSRYEAEAPAFR